MSKEEKVVDVTDSYRDQLPEDLDITRAQAAYRLPSMSRRRGYAVGSWVLAAALLLLWLDYGNGVYVNDGYLVLGISLVLLGGIFGLTGWPLNVREIDAVSRASSETKFSIGHIAAQLGWQGVRSRPTWRVLLYSDENPPKERALVLIDGVDGHVVYSETEANPEDWSADLATAQNRS